MKIWVDLATAPQVLFMQPLVVEMRRRGHEVLITTRDFTETISLADRCGLDHTPVGVHGGKTIFGKINSILGRAMLMARLVRSQHISLAVSHGSISQAIAAAGLHMPMIGLGDYEGNPANHLVCKVVKRLIVPEVFREACLRRYRLTLTDEKIVSYAGIKEQVYLATFRPDPHFRENLGISAEHIVVTMRPPSTVSAYHRFKNTIFDDTLEYVAGHADTVVVLLPRGAEQRQKYAGLELRNVIVPRTVLDGPQLVYCSDLVIGAGGTMNREATVLGTPVFSQFQGLTGTVDNYLIEQGKMKRVVDTADIPSIKICKKQRVNGEPWKKGAGLVCEVVDKILS
jgi:predicted glycosyltransferase